MVNLIIIDASGSMSSKVEEVRGGLKLIFKQIKEDYQNETPEKQVSLHTYVIDFSNHDDINILVNSGNPEDLSDRLADKYEVRGMTALFDAIGFGIQLVEQNEKDVFVSVLTDGAENASQKFNHSAIKELIASKEKMGWVFTFLGTTKEALQNAEQMGFKQGNSYQWADDKVGATEAFNAISAGRKLYYDVKVKGKEVDLEKLMGDGK